MLGLATITVDLGWRSRNALALRYNLLGKPKGLHSKRPIFLSAPHMVKSWPQFNELSIRWVGALRFIKPVGVRNHLRTVHKELWTPV